MDDFSKGFFDSFCGGIFADSPALAVILILVVAFVGFLLFAKLHD